MLINLKVEPQSRADQTRLMDAALELERRDPLFRVFVDPESGEIILGGQSEVDLDTTLYRLLEDFQVNLVVGAPQVAYRETVTAVGEAEFTHDRMSGSTREFARVKLRVEPRVRGAGNVFESTFRDHPQIRGFSAAVAKGVASVLDNGVLIGFPIVDTKVVWIDGAFDNTDSTPSAFEISARGALMSACKAAGIRVLEPIMRVGITAPANYEKAIRHNLDSRRGQVLDDVFRDGAAELTAHVPLANMFGYVSDLKRLSNDQASHTMAFSHYQLLPDTNSGDGPDKFPPAVGMRA